ncbi:MAG: toxin-antitoxin system TumE family protein, partial [Oscillochloridaceae bacterium umkhey_bin13]
YYDQIVHVLDIYAKTRSVLHTQINMEHRPGGQGYLAGSVTFQDGSVLFLREYLSTSGSKVQREMYSYHYQDAAKHLRFRYDNALHRPPLNMREHKHTLEGIIEGVAPTLAEVLHEIVATLGIG